MESASETRHLDHRRSTIDSERLLYPSAARSVRPIGWSRDGAWIYVVEGKIGLFRGATSFVGETMTDVKIVRIA